MSPAGCLALSLRSKYKYRVSVSLRRICCIVYARVDDAVCHRLCGRQGGGSMSETTANQGTVGPSGLGGWLVLVGIGLMVMPIRLAFLLLQTFPPLFRDGVWEALTTPGTESYHALWGPLLIFELVGNTLFIVVGIAMLWLFFQRSRRFPALFMAVMVVNVLFVLVDAWLGTFVLPNDPMFDPDTARGFGRALIAAAIWVPYMSGSKRVANTFVE
jgi:hypothetical protein